MGQSGVVLCWSRNSDATGEKGRRRVDLVDVCLPLPLTPGGDVAVDNLAAPPHLHRGGGGGAAGLRGEVDLGLPGGGERLLAGVNGGVVQHLPGLQRLRLRPGLADGQQAGRRILTKIQQLYCEVD